MPTLSQDIDNLLGGVSQLPQEQRLPNQFQVLENALLSPQYGLMKRPPTSAVGTVSTSQTGYDSAFIHCVNRSPTERYMVVVTNGTLKVYDTITGAEQTVHTPDGLSYISGSTRGFRAFTVGDHTFIVNRQTEVQQGTTFSDAALHEALLFVRQVDYGVLYTVTLDGDAVVVATPAEGSSDVRVTTEWVAEKLYEALQANDTLNSKFNFTLMGSTVHVVKPDESDFLASVSDGLADKGLRLIKGSVQSVEDLPARARPGMVLEIAGNPGSTKDNYWVVYEQEKVDTVFGEAYSNAEGVWKETVAPRTGLDLDASTMPHELVRQGYLEPLVASTRVLRQPTWRQEAGTVTETGWSTDEDDVALDGTTAEDKVVVGSGQVRSAGVNGTHATKTQRVKLYFDVDTGDAYARDRVTVKCYYNTAGSWVLQDRRLYEPGRYSDEYFQFDMVVPSGTKFALELVSSSTPPRGLATPNSRLPRLIAHGTDNANAGIQVAPLPSLMVSMGTPGMNWPRGLVVNLTLDGVAFSYTLTSDMTTAQLHAALSSLIDAHASFVSTYSAPSGLAVSLELDEFTVQKSSGDSPPAVSVATATLAAATKCWSPGLSMTTDEHVGRILKNLTDGSEGTITANSGFAFQVDALTGGAVNEFRNGDKIAVAGTGAAYYVFKKCDWADREVGNDELAPFPGFVGRQINDVFFHAGRLGFVAEDRVCMSSTEDLYRFFRKTCTQVLDDDPIDIQSAHKDVAFFDAAVQWDGELFLSSSGHQFVLAGDPYITPATVTLTHLSSFPASTQARPLVLGTSVFFPRKGGSASEYTQVREVFKDRDGLKSQLITQHVPRYIRGDVIDMCGDADLGMLAVLADGSDQTVLYIYNFGAYEGQKAWHKWDFNAGRILGIDLFEGCLYVVLYRSSQVRLEKIDLTSFSTSGDYRDLGSASYTMTAELSRLILRDRDGLPLNTGRTQIRTLTAHYSNTGFLKVSVAPTHATSKVYTVDTSPPTEGKKRVPILSENSKVTISLLNDNAKGCAVTSLEFEATYAQRSRAL